MASQATGLFNIRPWSIVRDIVFKNSDEVYAYGNLDDLCHIRSTLIKSKIKNLNSLSAGHKLVFK